MNKKKDGFSSYPPDYIGQPKIDQPQLKYFTLKNLTDLFPDIHYFAYFFLVRILQKNYFLNRKAVVRRPRRHRKEDDRGRLFKYWNLENQLCN
ncbi:MAG: hypothetical protein KAR17_23800 [Cyclobacteriaceae bacterium]|nr:hypothetical protein [Cyclobacteriaceae bacterium]